MSELCDHELKPILVKGSKGSYRTPFLGKCYFEQKEGAPHEVYVTLCSSCAVHTGVSCLQGLRSSESLPPSLEITGFQITNCFQHSCSLLSHENDKELPEIRANCRIRNPTLNTHITVYFADNKSLLKVKVLSEESL